LSSLLELTDDDVLEWFRDAPPLGHTPRKRSITQKSGLSPLPVLLANVNRVDVHAIFEPPILVGYLDVIGAHLPLLHEAVFGKCPVLIIN